MNKEEGWATEEEIFNAVYHPETVKFKNKEDQEFWDKICNLTDKQVKEIFERVEKGLK